MSKVSKKPVLAWGFQWEDGKLHQEAFASKSELQTYIGDNSYGGKVVRVQLTAYKPKKKKK